MPCIRINDVEIQFPFEPYSAQAEYMSSVLTTLSTSGQALLESPTGTGKTLCLLCSTCAWVKQQRDTSNASISFKPIPRQPSSGKGVMGQPEPPAVMPMRIVYTSRTHAQLAQVIREFKKTSYASTFTMAVLGSREHLCVHNSVSKMTSAQSMNSACSSVRGEQQCRFYNKIQFQLGNPQRLRTLSGADIGLGATDDHSNYSEGERRPSMLSPVHDVEDLVKAGRSVGFCPYFYERAVSRDAEIVFLPYTYLFDPSVRKQLPFSLEDSILIIDEAHNLPSVLSGSANTNLHPVAIAQAMRELSVAIETLRNEVRGGELDREREIQHAAKEEGFSVWKLLLARLEDTIDTTAQSKGKHIDALRRQSAGAANDEAMTRIAVPPPPGGGGVSNEELVLCGSSIFDILRSADLTAGNWRGSATEGGLGEVLNQAMGALSTSDAGCPGLQALQAFLTNVFETEGSFTDVDENCRVVLQATTPAQGSTSYYGRGGKHAPSSTTAASTSWTLGFWSLNTTSSMLRAIHGTRALILTSGTLSPMDHFAAELGVPFDVTLVGKHVIRPNQVMCSILAKGPSGASLNASYAFRGSEEYRLALGYSILNLARNVPNGVLVFFPSYAAMNGALEMWKMTGGPQCDVTIWSQLSELKSLFVEPSDGGELPLVIQNFQQCAEKDGRGGALLFAVCRGKISEGVDFSDKHGRCVMVVGIPYANQGDLFVRLKRQYITLSAPRRPKVRGKLFTGDDWYRQEALRSVNQAIGRVIRHKDDFGCVVLGDPRYVQLVDGLSAWITTSLERHETFGETYAAVAQFFHRWKRGGGAVQLDKRQPLGSDAPNSGDFRGVTTMVPAVAPATAKQADAFLELDKGRRKAEAHAHMQQEVVSGPSDAPARPAQKPPAAVFEKQEVSSAATTSPHPGPMSSMEFCEMIKRHTSAEGYATFRGFLAEVAAMKRERMVTPSSGEAPKVVDAAEKKQSDAAFIAKFSEFTNRVVAFFESSYTSDTMAEKKKMMLLFGEFLPPVFQSLLIALLRKRRRDEDTPA
ncbi:DEAD/DEAH box RNA helicase, putative [Bodo saltans]|uniref:DEAD/DEAH box RNA helicase, putative n=1 Tax=Bodo saltans TaxID=75058 RepID=A0A0S4KH73_BODSA|nr:DEAD/DEAH box RNA helicase, putative [Bodo saltans]|eukprot:CUI12354.1 DEAD/DEAH box RNA helicase, putative [Bodo saltans]